MKKSQVLATLALAFALGLGVVAPVANTVFAGATYAVESRAVETATEQDVLNAISKVENYGPYKNYKALIDAAEDYAGETLSDGTTTVKTSTPTSLAGAIAGAVDTVTGSTGTTYVSLNSAIAAAGRVQNYGAYNSLYNLMEEDDDKVAASSLSAAILGIDNSNATKNAIKDMTVEELKNYVTNTWSFGSTYESYADLFKAVADGNLYNDITTALKNALNNVKTWSKNSDGKTLVDIAMADADPAKALNNLINETNLPAFNEYQALDAALTAAKNNADDNGETANNQTLINNIDTALKNATAVVPGEEVSLADLSGTTTTPTITITSADKNVTVTGKLPAGTEVKVKKSDNKVAAFGDRKYGMWDITLVNAKGETVTFEGNLTVTIKVPEGINGEKAGVYFADAKGNVQKYASTYKDGALTFTTNHLSLWAIVEDNGETITTPKSPDTGIIANEANASTTVAMVAGLATALTAAGAGVVAYRNARRSTRK